MPGIASLRDHGDTKVAIVVLNYTNYWDTITCLDSLERVLWSNREIIVVDNASNNDSLEQIGQHLTGKSVPWTLVDDEAPAGSPGGPPPFTFLLQAAENRGYAVGNNIGIRLALARGAEFVLVLNNDTVVEDDFLAPLIRYMRAHKNVGATGPMVVDPGGRIDPTCARRRPAVGDFFFRLGLGRSLFPRNRWIRRHTYDGEYLFDEAKKVDILSGSCILFAAGALRDIGLFDEHTFLFCEELILHERLRAAGLTAAVVPTSRIVHKHGQAVSTVPSKFVRATERRSLRYYWVHYRGLPSILVTALLAIGPDVVNLLRKCLRSCRLSRSRELRN